MEASIYLYGLGKPYLSMQVAEGLYILGRIVRLDHNAPNNGQGFSAFLLIWLLCVGVLQEFSSFFLVST
jgi:hypothetical protein